MAFIPWAKRILPVRMCSNARHKRPAFVTLSRRHRQALATLRLNSTLLPAETATTARTQPYVALVTGASRGAGKGIALALAATGATVYVTGRTQREGDSTLSGTVHSTAIEIDTLSGKGIASTCHHADDQQVAEVFEHIRHANGQLDIFVNNATMLHEELIRPAPFLETPLNLVDILDVGLRSA